MTSFFHQIRWQDCIDIVVVAVVIYYVLQLIKGTRARQLIVGLLIVLITFAIARKLELFTLGWLLNSFVGSIVIVIVILFQDDIRRLLINLGRSPFFKGITYVKETLFFDELTNACTTLSQRGIGALIVIEREVGLEEFMEIGVQFDAEVNTELIVSIFHHASPLHDGALIIREGRVKAAGSILPLTMKDGIGKDFGTRHRAAIGITEVTDAVALVVSEERRHISYAYRGNIVSGLSGDMLHKVLQELLV